MKNAELLESLVAVAREEDPARDPRWRALAEGRLSEEGIAALEMEAGRSDEGRRLLDAHRPLDAASRARITEEVLARIAMSEASVGEVPIVHAPPPHKGTVSTPSPIPKPPTPAPKSPSAGRSLPTQLVALLGVVLIGLAVWLFGGGGDDLPSTTAHWVMTIEAEQSQRGAALPGERAHLGPGSTFTAVLRPEVQVDGAIEARAFLVRDERARAWDVPIELAPGGAARITGTKEALFPGVGAGRWEVLVAIGLPGTLPDLEQVRAIAAQSVEQRAAQRRRYRVYSQEIELRDSRDP